MKKLLHYYKIIYTYEDKKSVSLLRNIIYAFIIIVLYAIVTISIPTFTINFKHILIYFTFLSLSAAGLNIFYIENKRETGLFEYLLSSVLNKYEVILIEYLIIIKRSFCNFFTNIFLLLLIAYLNNITFNIEILFTLLLVILLFFIYNGFALLSYFKFENHSKIISALVVLSTMIILIFTGSYVPIFLTLNILVMLSSLTLYTNIDNKHFLP